MEQENTPIYVWLDSSANSNNESSKKVEKHLKTKLRNLKTFNVINDCKEFIEIHDNENIILILSGSYGRQIVPQIYNLPHLSAVYVYYSHKARNLEWAKEYTKVC
ncbi:unnamed protein product [Rotaria sp. Silwood1]|nr:unnamed protein product [Rotaria sp. Silwood1]